jgi:hypothetical protein
VIGTGRPTFEGSDRFKGGDRRVAVIVELDPWLPQPADRTPTGDVPPGLVKKKNGDSPPLGLRPYRRTDDPHAFIQRRCKQNASYSRSSGKGRFCSGPKKRSECGRVVHRNGTTLSIGFQARPALWVLIGPGSQNKD